MICGTRLCESKSKRTTQVSKSDGARGASWLERGIGSRTCGRVQCQIRRCITAPNSGIIARPPAVKAGGEGLTTCHHLELACAAESTCHTVLHLRLYGGSARRHTSCPRLPTAQLGAGAGSNHDQEAPLRRSETWPQQRTLLHKPPLEGKIICEVLSYRTPVSGRATLSARLPSVGQCGAGRQTRRFRRFVTIPTVKDISSAPPTPSRSPIRH